MIEGIIGGVSLRADPACISCLRYRARYGESVISSLKRGGKRISVLLKIVHCMIPKEDKVSFDFLTGLCYRNEKEFTRFAESALYALLTGDGKLNSYTDGEAGNNEEFDEYELLISLSFCSLPVSIIYELPVMHIAAIINRIAAMKDPEYKPMRKMTSEEMKSLYPR